MALYGKSTKEMVLQKTWNHEREVRFDKIFFGWVLRYHNVLTFINKIKALLRWHYRRSHMPAHTMGKLVSGHGIRHIILIRAH